MGEDFDHGRDKHEDIFSVEEALPLGEVCFEIGHAFFHLDVTLLDCIYISALFLKDVVASVLYDVGMGVDFDFGEEFYFLDEDELLLLLIEAYFLDALDGVFLVGDFVDNAVAGTDDLPDLETLEEGLVSPEELHCFIVHDY